jgi:DUF3054 family protein
VTRLAPARRTLPTWVLAAGDAAAIIVFAVLGLLNHDEGITAAGLARNVAPILGVWFAIAPFTGVYNHPGFRRMMVTWAIAVPVGVAIRAVALHRAADEHQVAFAIVALLVTLVFLSAWRAIASRIR